MRTTLSLNSELLQRAKELSAKTGQTLTSIIENGLRAILNGPPSSSERNQKIILHTYKGKGLKPGVDLDYSSSLLDIMEPE